MQKQKKMYRSVLLLLAASAVFLVMYFLCFPAFTLEQQKTICGVEAHEHQADCYEQVLICGQEEATAHIHGDACYIEKQTLVCEIEDAEHEHTADCHETENVLICEEAENQGHEHTDACYQQELVCEHTEHEHTESCYEDAAEKQAEETAQTEETETEQSNTEKQIYTYEDDVLTATAVPAAGTILSEDAKLIVKEISADSKEYEAYQELLKESQIEEPDDLAQITEPQIKAYDIGFYVDGEEVEPENGKVAVTLTYKKAEIAAEKAEDISLYHVVEDGNTMSLEEVKKVDAEVSAEATIREVAFEAEQFSAYLINPNNYTMNTDKLEYVLVDETAETFTNTSYYNASNPLGIAGHFHVVAFQEARLGAHTNGNILAKDVYANSNFGANNYGPEISYIQNYRQVNSTSAANEQSVLVLGSDNQVELVDNGGSFNLNNTKLDKPYRVWQDADTAQLPFIDLNQVENESRTLSTELQKYETQNVTEDTSDMNNRKLTLENTAVLGVYKTTLQDLNNKYGSGDGSTMKVQGFSAGKHGTLVINIDCQNAATVNLPNIHLYVDGQDQPFSEVTTDVNGKIILNFINAEGSTINLSRTYATVIAPGSTVNVRQNLNGTIIGQTVNINAESHRTDFSGINPEETIHVEALKEWRDASGTIMASAATDGFSATVQLICTEAGGTPYVVDERVLNRENGWNYTWTGLPTERGETYEVVEISYQVTDDKEYTASTAEVVTEDGKTITLTNREKTDKPPVLNLNVQKTWLDENGNQLETGYPDSITVTLYRKTESGEPERVEAVALNSNNNWQYAWSDYPAADTNGNTYTYYIEETVPEGYAAEYSNNQITANSTDTTIALTNKREIQYGLELPETGGVGSTLFAAIGGLLIAAALFILLYREKRRSRKEIAGRGK